jgi:hypothetical protein
VQGAAAVGNTLYRAAVFTAHPGQMHLIGLNDAFQCVNGGVAS